MVDQIVLYHCISRGLDIEHPGVLAAFVFRRSNIGNYIIEYLYAGAVQRRDHVVIRESVNVRDFIEPVESAIRDCEVTRTVCLYGDYSLIVGIAREQTIANGVIRTAVDQDHHLLCRRKG